MANIGFSDFDVDAQEIEQRRKYAEMLRQQSMEPVQSQMAGGWVIPTSPFQGMAKMLQAYSGRKGMEKADEEKRALGSRYREQLADVLKRGTEAASGTPEYRFGATPVDDEGNPNVRPAQAPNPMQAASIFMGHPATQPMGMAAAQQGMTDQRRQAMIAQILGGGAQQGQTPQQGQMPGQPAGGQSGTGLDPKVQALLVSGDPALVELGKQMQAQRKPIAVSEGGGVFVPGQGMIASRPKLGENVLPQYDQQGNVIGVSPMPGAADAAAGQAAAVEGAKAKFDFIDVPVPGGGTQRMSRAEAARLLNPQPVNRQTAPTEADAVRMINQGGGAPMSVGVQSPGTPIGRSASDADKKTQSVIAEGMGKQYNQLQESGVSANQRIQKAERLAGLLDGLNTGKLAPAGYEIAAWAKSLGLPVGEKVGNAQAAQMVLNELALEARNPSGGAGMPGAMSDADRQFLVNTVASLGKDPQANKLFIDAMKKLAERDAQVARMAREYRKKNGTFDDGFFDELQNFSNQNPLFPAPPASTGPSNASGKIGGKPFVRSGEFKLLGVEK